MMTKTEWADKSWNPITVTDCTPVTEGCANCYARRMAGRYGYPEAPHHFDVTLHPDRLKEPLRWRKPWMVFVCSMNDLFHEDIPFEFIHQVFDIMQQASQHTFQVLTKRPERMYRFLKIYREWPGRDLPLPNIWGLVTAENQEQLDKRVPWLMKCWFIVRGVSCEPLLGPINLHLQQQLPCSHRGCYNHITHPCEGCGRIPLDWVIIGGESGPGARPMHPDWAQSLRDQCKMANVPFFFKQYGAWVHESQWKSYTLEPLERRGRRMVKCHWWPDETVSYCIGKKAAGRLLDGREWSEMPNIHVHPDNA